MYNTESLYYCDAYSHEFHAKIVHIKQMLKGYALILDKTCFYPEGGGQPGDSGFLDELRIVDCIKQNGIIYHLSDSLPKMQLGDNVHGRIDYERRFGFMQNHSGDHLFTGLVRKYFGCENVGFHLSERGMTIDFDAELNLADIEKLEKMANDAILKKIPIEINSYKFTELQNIDFRSKRDFDEEDEIRIVKIGEYDLCACAGLHVSNTAEIGILKVVGLQRHRGGTRVSLYCGQDALWDYSIKDSQLQEISQLISTKSHIAAEGVQRILSNQAELKQRIVALKERINYLYLESIERDAVACIFEEDLNGDDMRRLASLLAEKAKLACVFCEEIPPKTGVKYTICTKSPGFDLGAFINEFNAVLQGRGGLKGELASGAVSADKEAILAYIENLRRSLK